jgi:hypothetical protein
MLKKNILIGLVTFIIGFELHFTLSEPIFQSIKLKKQLL